MKKGYELLNDPFLNKGTAFTEEEREKYDLIGILPPTVQTLDLQAQQAYENVEKKPDVSEKRHYLMNIFSRNRTLFFYLFSQHGGGAVSYSPGDWEYDYQSYLHFDTVNIGKSGDTSASMLKRFDQDVLPLHLRYLIIMGGTNSLLVVLRQSL